MACLDNIIGLRDGCGGTLIASDTDTFLNDLEGVSVDKLADAIDRESESAVQLVTRQIAFAQKLVVDRLRERIKRRFGIETLIDSEQAGIIPDRPQSQAAQAFYTGIQIKVMGNPDSVVNVDRVSLFVNFSGAVDVKAWDARTGLELQSETITAIAGQEVEAVVDWQFKAMGQRTNVFIGYDATAVASYETNLSEGRACRSCQGGKWNLRHAQVYTRKSATGANPLDSSLVNQDGTSGLSVSLSVTCDAEYFLCGMRHQIRVPMLYKVGEHLLRQMQYSNRLSPGVLAFKGDHEELATHYREQYEMAMQDLLDNIRVPNRKCFRCEPVAKAAVALP